MRRGKTEESQRIPDVIGDHPPIKTRAMSRASEVESVNKGGGGADLHPLLREHQSEKGSRRYDGKRIFTIVSELVSGSIQ